jgi:hypothetical protein
MRDTTKSLMKALTKHIAHKIITGKESLVRQEAVRRAFRESMSERIAPKIKAAADLQRKEGLTPLPRLLRRTHGSTPTRRRLPGWNQIDW